MLVLGIDVDEALVRRWVAWLMPIEQPFWVPLPLAIAEGWIDDRQRLSFELRDAFELYDQPDGMALVWLTRQQAAQLPGEVRRLQPAAHRWPSKNVDTEVLRAVRYVEAGRRQSRHREVDASHWRQIAGVVPGARQLAGTFASRSGPNCFATVMAAAGVSGAAQQWIQIDAFERWLAQSTREGGNDDRPGTVLLWRDPQGQAAHAAISLGAGLLLHKPSQGWMSPIKVLSVAEGKFSARTPGRHLTRHHLI